MPQEMLQGFRILHGILLIAVALGFFWFWARTRFWLPMYIHVLAIIALLLGILMASAVSNDTPTGKEGPFAKILLAFAFPAIVYFFFVFYGGQKAACQSRFLSLSTCPHCKKPVEVDSNKDSKSDGKGSEVKQYCPHCGHELGYFE